MLGACLVLLLEGLMLDRLLLFRNREYAISLPHNIASCHVNDCLVYRFVILKAWLVYSWHLDVVNYDSLEGKSLPWSILIVLVFEVNIYFHYLLLPLRFCYYLLLYPIEMIINQVRGSIYIESNFVLCCSTLHANKCTYRLMLRKIQSEVTHLICSNRSTIKSSFRDREHMLR